MRRKGPKPTIEGDNTIKRATRMLTCPSHVWLTMARLRSAMLAPGVNETVTPEETLAHMDGSTL